MAIILWPRLSDVRTKVKFPLLEVFNFLLTCLTFLLNLHHRTNAMSSPRSTRGTPRSTRRTALTPFTQNADSHGTASNFGESASSPLKHTDRTAASIGIDSDVENRSQSRTARASSPLFHPDAFSSPNRVTAGPQHPGAEDTTVALTSDAIIPPTSPPRRSRPVGKHSIALEDCSRLLSSFRHFQ